MLLMPLPNLGLPSNCGFLEPPSIQHRAVAQVKHRCRIGIRPLFGSVVTASSRACAAWAIALTSIGSPKATRAQDLPNDAGISREASLPRVVAAAQDFAPEVSIGRSVLRASKSVLVGARLWPIQNPYFEVTATRTDKSTPTGTLFQASAWLPFEISGQRGRRISQAEAYVGMHQMELKQARAAASGAAVRAWGRALVETERIRTLAEIASSAESESKAFRVRSDVGDATERDAQLAEVEYARHLMLIEEANVALDTALGELKRLTHRNWQVPPQDQVRPRPDLDRLNPTVAAAQSPFVQASHSEAEYYARTDATLASEATGPVSLILSGGHGTLGETVMGGGVAFTIPAWRRNQGERARAQSERDRAFVQSDVTRKDVEMRLTTILKEARGLRLAQDVLDGQALPAAQAARRASEKMFEMGKIDILAVLVSRRDEALLRLKHLDLAEREWERMADWAELTGAVP